MDLETIKKLVQLNYNFYQNIGKIWNNDEGYFWEGWKNILTHLQNKTELNILDIGCGNGRFAEFLCTNFPDTKINYIGIDFSEYLTKIAKERKPNKINDYKIVKTDIIFESWEQVLKNNKFDLICMFGVTHHIPGFYTRMNLLQKCKSLLDPNGILVFTNWQYLDSPRLQKRVLADVSESGIDISKLESGDNILDWVKLAKSYRYSHYFDEGEMQTILKNLDMKVLETYYNDGRESKTNRYFILKK